MWFTLLTISQLTKLLYYRRKNTAEYLTFNTSISIQGNKTTLFDFRSQ